MLRLVLVLVTACHSLDHDLRFLHDFFADRSSLITLNTCWTKSKSASLFKTGHSNRLSLYRDNLDELKERSNEHLVIDLRECDKANDLLARIDHEDMFKYPLKYLLLVEDHLFDTLRGHLTEYKILPNGQVTVASFTPDQESVTLQALYRVGNCTSEIITETLGKWRLRLGMTVTEHETVTRRRRDLQGVPLVAGIVIYDNDSWHHLTDFVNPGIDTFPKQDFETVNCMFQYLNITYTLKGSPSYGYYDESTHRWSGLVGDIYRGDTDVSACSAYFTMERYQIADFVKMGNPLAFRFIVRKPSTSYVRNIFYLTFSDRVWVATFGIMVIFVVPMLAVLNWERGHKDNVKQDRYGVSDVALITLEAMCQQGTATEPQSLGGRVMALFLFGSFMFIYVSYSANIVVLLQSTQEITHLSELLTNRFEVAGQDVFFLKEYLEREKKGVLRELYVKKIRPNHNYFSIEEGMTRLRQGGFAFHVIMQTAYEYILRNFTNYDVCGLQELPGYMEHNKGYLALGKRSPYKDFVKVGILRMDEYGIQKRTNLRVILKPKCFSNTATFKSVGIFDCYQVFYVWIIGVGGAVTIFGLEHIYRRYYAEKQ